MKHKIGAFIGALVLILSFGVRVFTQVQDTPIYLSFEQRLALSYAISAVNKSETEQAEIAARAKKIALKIKEQPVKTIKVDSFEEFLNQFRGEWPNTHKLSLDLSLIEKREDLAVRLFESDNAEVQEKIEAYTEAQARYFKRYLEKRGIAIPTMAEAQMLGVMAIAAGERTMSQELVKQGSALLKEEMKIIDELGEKVISSGQMSSMNGGMKRVMELAIGDYFKHLSIDSKAQIMNIGLGERLDLNDMEKFEILISGAGPQFQKLLQIMARESSISQDLLSVFRKLESNVRPVPWVLVNEITSSEANNYEIISVESKPLGVGTMAQVHKGKIKLDNGEIQEVVIRFLKPDIAERVEEDRRILSELAPKIDSDPILIAEKFPPLAPIVNELTRTVVDELDLMATMERQGFANKRYTLLDEKVFLGVSKKLRIAVPAMFMPKTKTTRLMIQELASGKKLDKVAETYKSEIPDLKIKIVESLAKLWVREVLFGEGFFHADLHQGNFLVDVAGHEVLLNLLDFGMAGTLTKEMRQSILSLAAGLEILKPKVIADAFWDLSDKDANKISYDEFYLKVDGLTRDMKNGIIPLRSLDQWTSFALNNGVQLPYTFINLNRGFVILNKLLAEVGSEFEMSLLAKKEARSKPITVIKGFWKTKDITLFDIVKIAYYYVSQKLPFKKDNLIVQAYSSEGIQVRGGLKCQLLFAK